nr:hypothetical protein OG461_10900 [Streptomyces sp. NBC_00995]
MGDMSLASTEPTDSRGSGEEASQPSPNRVAEPASFVVGSATLDTRLHNDAYVALGTPLQKR